jgi:hypothetical protein
MTDRAVFAEAEWDLLVRLPRWVASAAGAAQSDGALRSAAEQDVGLLAVAGGRESPSPFVASIARRLIDTYDDPDGGPDFADAAKGIASVYDRAQTAAQLLAAKADGADASAYRKWLLTIADMVVGQARSGGVFGMGGSNVSAAERQFCDGLAQALKP